MGQARAATARAYDLTVALATIIVLGCTVALALEHRGAGAFLDEAPGAQTAAVFLQERDCTSNLAFLQLLARPEFSHRFTVVVYDVGGRRSINRMTAHLRGQDLPFRVAPAPPGSLPRLRRMGYRSTPVLVLVDQGSRVRLATAAPTTADEMQRLASALHVLTGAVTPPRGG